MDSGAAKHGFVQEGLKSGAERIRLEKTGESQLMVTQHSGLEVEEHWRLWSEPENIWH